MTILYPINIYQHVVPAMWMNRVGFGRYVYPIKMENERMGGENAKPM